MSRAAVYAAGSVRRWHANPVLAHLGQTNADHQGRCVQLLFAFHPGPSVALIRAVAHHDVAERWVGDLPAYFKADHPGLAAEHAAVERDYLTTHLGFDPFENLSSRDETWLALIDKLEAFAQVCLHAPGEIKTADWLRSRRRLLDLAFELGSDEHDRVADFIDAMEQREW